MPRPKARKTPVTIDLPPRLDGGTAAELHATLLAARGKPLVLSGGAVTYLGGLGAQLLLAARQTWGAAELDLTLDAPSDALREGLVRLGLTETLECKAEERS